MKSNTIVLAHNSMMTTTNCDGLIVPYVLCTVNTYIFIEYNRQNFSNYRDIPTVWGLFLKTWAWLGRGLWLFWSPL